MHQASHVMRTTVLLSRNIRPIRCSHHNKRHRRPTKLTAQRTPFRGIYGIPVTPFNEDETIDWKSMESVLHFTVEAGCHGVVMPVMVSEFQVLSDDERRQIVETTVRVVGGRVPVVAGVTGIANAHSIGMAKHAEDAGVDAVIAMPPHSKPTTESEVLRFFHELGAAVDIPVFVQNFGGAYAMPTDTLAQLSRDVPNLSYVKEEGSDPLQAATRIIEAAGDDILGVMGGFGARMLLDEWRRGEAGNMPSSHYGDVHSNIWNLLEAGDEEGARAMYQRILPLVLHDDLPVLKEIFVRRGIIANSTMRSPYGIHGPDKHGWEEIDYLYEQASDLFTWKKS